MIKLSDHAIHSTYVCQAELSVKPKKKTPKANKKVVVVVDSGSDEPSEETDFKECESRLILV